MNEISQLILSNIGEGEDNATHLKELVNISGLSERDLRKTIEGLRRTGFVIVSSSNGYYKPSTLTEVRRHIRKESRRAMSIFYTLKSARQLETVMEERGGEMIDNG